MGGNVLIIRVPRSYHAPHRIIRQNSNRFWARSAAGKYEPDVNELRTIFNAGPHLADRIRNFRIDRIAKIAAGQAPVQLMNRGSLILHIVPLSAFDLSSSLPLHQIEGTTNPLCLWGLRQRIVLELILTASSRPLMPTHKPPSNAPMSNSTEAV